MSRQTYPVDLEPDDNGTVMATIPDLDTEEAGSGATFGVDAEEALFMAQDLLEVAVSLRIERGLDIPPASPANGRPTVALSAMSAVKAALYATMRETGITKAELARRLGWHFPQVARLLDPRHHSRLDQLQQAFAAMGKQLAIDVVDQSRPTTKVA